VETFLWAAATHKQCAGRERVELHQLLDAVNAALSPAVLPFRHAITQLNRLRINSKHYGLHPDAKEAQRLLIAIGEFLREATNEIFDADFWTVSLLNLLPDDPHSVLYWLQQAEDAFRDREYRNSLVYCRYAIYMEFEQNYDISLYENPDYKPWFGSFISEAPYWALNAQYINETVNHPCDYIVINHDNLQRKLWENGIDPTVFWNVRRLTPDVFLPRDNDRVAVFFGSERVQRTL
jgi:hypothetical protein